MAHRRISGHSPMEPIAGYSRAVVAGDHVYVSGTAPIPADRGDPPSSPYDQARLCLAIIAGALEQAGARPEDVVRTRIYLLDAVSFDDVARAHREVFGEILPATSAIVVSGLLDPRWLVEIEAVAVLSDCRA